jgi:hypothetical protein
MKNIKNIALFVVIVLSVIMATRWYYGREIQSLNDRFREYREENSVIVNHLNTEIGEYQSKVAIQEKDLTKTKSLLEEQRTVVKELEKDLDVKVEIVNTLAIQVDSLRTAGIASFVIVEGDTVQYHIKEHKNGVGLDLTLKHPSGEFNYTIVHDPIKMELYVAKEKTSEMKVGSIRFPNNPGLSITQWDIFYDPDTRGWFEKLWDDVHFSLGVYGGADSGVFGFAGYKKVGFGPVITEKGTAFGFIYRLK